MTAPSIVLPEQFHSDGQPVPQRAQQQTLRVVVACRQLLVGQALGVGLTSLGDIQVTVLHPDDVASASRGWDTADVVLIALEAKPSRIVAALHQKLPATTRIVVMAEQVDLLSIAECVGEGASGYLTADATVDEIGNALRKILSGQMILPWLRSASAMSIDLAGGAPGVAEGGHAGLEKLTPREHEIVRRLTRGQSTAEIAEDLQISINTTRSHVQHLLKKLQLHSRLELTAFAVRNRLLR